VEAHLDHAAGYAEAVVAGGSPPARAVDLGSGGGVPGLPLALHFSACRWVLVESGVRRAAFLREAVVQLGVADRVAVVEERAEVVGRRTECRGTFDLVVARSFGPPAVVAECAAPLLRVGGRAVVSEPPGGAPARWPAAGLARLGLAFEVSVQSAGATYQALLQTSRCPDRYPRRVGVPAKRPLF
jgi:16S rRNA (guanine527-N7)-methyltransferase